MGNLTNSAHNNAVSFGQVGSAFSDTATDTIQPPDGLVIVAIQFLADTSLSALVAEDSDNYFNSVAAAHTGGGQVDTSQVFPKGLTIFGRYTSVSINADDSDGGIIVYFG